MLLVHQCLYVISLQEKYILNNLQEDGNPLISSTPAVDQDIQAENLWIFPDNDEEDEKLVNLTIKLESEGDFEAQPDTCNDENGQTIAWLLPNQIQKADEGTEVVWRGHLTRFGLSKLKPFQKDAIQSVELCKDSVIVQPTASGKSMCYLLPALF